MKNVTRWSLVGAVCAVLVGTQLMADDSPAVDANPSANESTTGPASRPSRRMRPAIAPGMNGSPERRWDLRDLRNVREGRDRQGGFMAGRAPGDRYMNEEAPSDEEWTEIVDFMKVNSPVKLGIYEKIATALGVDTGVSRAARRRIAGRYRDLQEMKDRSNEMYDFAIKQLQIEDRVLGTLRDMRHADEDPNLKEAFRKQAGEYVENFLNEREARLKRLKEVVERETLKIEEDRAAINRLTEKQMDRFQNEMTRILEFSEDPGSARPGPPN